MLAVSTQQANYMRCLKTALPTEYGGKRVQDENGKYCEGSYCANIHKEEKELEVIANLKEALRMKNIGTPAPYQLHRFELEAHRHSDVTLITRAEK
jgi:hypothetical protein